MGKFTKQVEFHAFQFVPKDFANLDFWDIEDVVAEALGINDTDIKGCSVNQGQLYIDLYARDEEGYRKSFCLDPNDWLVRDEIGEFKSVTDEDFRKFATPVK